MTDLEKLVEKDAIRDQYYVYARALDRIDNPLGKTVFAEDAQVDYGPTYKGTGYGFIDMMLKMHRKMVSTHHVMTNILIKLNEDGTKAAKMEHVDFEEAQRRAELVMEIQTQVMDEFNDSRMGDTVEVLCDGWDGQSMSYVGRSYAESPGIDGSIYFTSDSPVEAGDFVRVRITGAMDGELTGERTEE